MTRVKFIPISKMQLSTAMMNIRKVTRTENLSDPDLGIEHRLKLGVITKRMSLWEIHMVELLPLMDLQDPFRYLEFIILRCFVKKSKDALPKSFPCPWPYAPLNYCAP